jgi:Flp pilus assembly protein TadB
MAELNRIIELVNAWLTEVSASAESALALLRSRISSETVIYAIMALCGGLIVLIALLSRDRVSLNGERAQLEGVREPGLLEKLQTRLYQSGIRVRVTEFIAVSIALGAGIGTPFFLLGFSMMGTMLFAAGPLLYYQYLMSQRTKALKVFREELPIAILDTRDHLVARQNDLYAAMMTMSQIGPPSLRPDFERAVRLMSGVSDTAEIALREVARSRDEPFFWQFFDTLANHRKGGDTAEVLTRVAHAQKAHNRLQSKTRARQSGLRIVGIAYMIAPPAMAVFMAAGGGVNAAEFYQTSTGQLIQLGAVISGVLSYWMSQKIGRRGLHMDESRGARLDTTHIPTYMELDEFGMPGRADDTPVVFAFADATAHVQPVAMTEMSVSSNTMPDAPDSLEDELRRFAGFQLEAQS